MSEAAITHKLAAAAPVGKTPVVSAQVILYTAICCGATAIWTLQKGSVSSTSPALLGLACLLIAALGVPHGGLDHWIGKQLLGGVFGSYWGLVFFPAYLLVSLAVVTVWFITPFWTILGFFVLSAWHFGREEANEQTPLAAVASGGILIWSIAIIRPAEMLVLVEALQLRPDGGASAAIVEATRIMGALLLPLGFVNGLSLLASRGRPKDFLQMLIVRLATVFIACTAPILLSFAIYFCFWHSWLGLQKLRRSESLSLSRFAMCVAPLSVAAVSLVVLSAWVIGDFSWESLSQSAVMRMLFIGLAAIAVPHILLHESEQWLQDRLKRRVVRLSWEAGR